MIKKIREIAQHYGYDSQTRQAMEELAELIQAISKHKRSFLIYPMMISRKKWQEKSTGR